MDKKPVMLVADDKELNRAILIEKFKQEFSIIEAENGLDVIEILGQKAPEIAIIILDIQMPKMNGFEVLKIMKQNKIYNRIPVIVNTQYGEEDNEIRALQLGAIDFIAKPYNPLVIHQRVRNIIEKTLLEHEQLNRSLDDTSKRLQVLVNSVPCGIAICELSDRVRLKYFNETICNICGFEKDTWPDLIGRDPLNIVLDEDRSILYEKVCKAAEDNSILKSEFRIICCNGEIKWISLVGNKYKEENGYPIFHMVMSDITDEMNQQARLKESLHELRYRTERDPLTGIYNREMFALMTKQMMEKDPDKRYVLVRLNVASFKIINELFGASTGDWLLKRIAVSLRRFVGTRGTYGRLEADNYVFCIPEEDVTAEQIIHSIERSNIGKNLNYYFAIYFGIYEIDDRKLPIDQMSDRANLALQTVKGSYIKHYAYYDKSMRAAYLEEQKIVSEMNDALENGQFCAYFQPIYSTTTNQIVSAEALVRWNHPQKGLVSPGKFIPVFEKNGFIVKLDAFIWEYACRYISERIKAGQFVVPISVNVSRLNLYNPKLCEAIVQLIQKYNIDPEYLKLEITESAYTDNPEQLLSMIQVLHEHGFQILMDDFGSGYSSLNMLKDMPVDVLKIDMKFIDNLETSKRAEDIISSVVRMAKGLKMIVVAEGVETKQQIDYLSLIGCDLIQGFYFSKPISATEFTDKLDKV